ncbi:helix-turn-helix domain-containing protein [Streptomyces sp. NPDC060198]|uniref:helix-turn-helix domain-containing protein n=1 Tax=Streptomyces sp. NPDC060198 TaxID=3347070 RepID=UPI00364E5B3A
MERDWARLGAALKAGREDLGLEQQQVAERIGVKRGALRNIEVGDVSRVTPTVRAYARTVGWTDDSVESVLAGGDPTIPDTPAPHSVATLADVTPDELPLRIKAALAAGPLLDAVVIDLPAAEGEDPEAQMVVIVKGRRQEATPEQIKRALLQWERAEAHIRKPGTG